MKNDSIDWSYDMEAAPFGVELDVSLKDRSTGAVRRAESRRMPHGWTKYDYTQFYAWRCQRPAPLPGQPTIDDDRDIAGYCETCSTNIYEGDMYGPCSDGVMLCAEHTFMLSDALEQQRDAVKAGTTQGFVLTLDELRENVASMEAEIAETGDRKVLRVA